MVFFCLNKENYLDSDITFSWISRYWVRTDILGETVTSVYFGDSCALAIPIPPLFPRKKTVKPLETLVFHYVADIGRRFQVIVTSALPMLSSNTVDIFYPL